MSTMQTPAIEQFFGHVSNGNDAISAAALADLPMQTVLSNLNAGQIEEQRITAGSRPRKTHAIHLEFWKTYQKSRAQARNRLITTIENHARDDWKAAKFALEYMDSGELGGGREDSAYYMGGSR